MDNNTIKCLSECVGLVVPVYDYGIPLVVKDFLQKLQIKEVKYIFAVVTCNYLPGLALESVDELLRKNGGKLNSGFVIRMPGTYLPMYGANSMRTQEKKFEKKKRKIEAIANLIRNRKKLPLEKSKLIIDRLLAKKMQKYIEKFHDMDSHFWTDEKCNGCGICKNVCAFDNIVIEEGKPKWLHTCQQCFACVHLCPKTSIQYDKKTIGRKRYQNPHVKLKDLIEQIQTEENHG